jgi:[ribosomal protein S5]-alanine N-acetyltransferase
MLTERLELELLTPEHAEALFDGLSDKRLYTFIDDEPPISLEALRQRYERLATRRSPDGLEIWLNWAVSTLQPRKYIGYVQATIRMDSWAVIAFVLFYGSWGNGYGQEAVTAMLQELQKTHAVSNFRAFVNPRNRRSRALLQSLGFEISKTDRPLSRNSQSKTHEIGYVLHEVEGKLTRSGHVGRLRKRARGHETESDHAG